MLSESELGALREIDTATITNALDRLLPGGAAAGYSYSSLELRCLLPELAPIVGYAVTCTGDSTSPMGFRTSPRNPDRSNQARALYEAIRDSPKPVVVVCQNVGPDRLMSNHFGDIMATTFQRLGAVGAITDGGIRDLAGVRARAPGFQMFAPGAVASGGVALIADVGSVVTVCGLTVAPGDLLHGDPNGVVNIPLAVADQVAGKSREVLEYEEKRVQFILSSEFSVEELARRSSW